MVLPQYFVIITLLLYAMFIHITSTAYVNTLTKNTWYKVRSQTTVQLVSHTQIY